MGKNYSFGDVLNSLQITPFKSPTLKPESVPFRVILSEEGHKGEPLIEGVEKLYSTGDDCIYILIKHHDSNTVFAI